MYDSPWLDDTRPLIIDPYVLNRIDWNALATDKRVVAIIHKATQGLKTDPSYARRRTKALELGYLWGSYHLATKGDPVLQAEHYLEVVGMDSTTLLAFDLESLSGPLGMSLANAERFIERVHQRSGRYPLLYCNKAVLDVINREYSAQSTLARCGLWYARFRARIPVFDTKVWTTYTLWQFSSEINCKAGSTCPYLVPGTQHDMDVNVYNGTVEQLRSLWPAIAAP